MELCSTPLTAEGEKVSPSSSRKQHQLCLTACPLPKRTYVYCSRLFWYCGQKPPKLQQGKKAKLFLPHPIPWTSILAQGWAELTFKYRYAKEHTRTPSTSSSPAAEMQMRHRSVEESVNPQILHPVSLYADIVLPTATPTVPWNTGQMLHTNIGVYQPKKHQWNKQEMR